MSTALLYCGTSEGFVIGTDSRGLNKQTGQPGDHERKIFAFEKQPVSVVFAWAGNVSVVGSSFGAVDLITETYESLSRLAFDNLFFATDLAADLKRKLRIFTVNTTGTHAVGVFLAFLNGSPWVSEITISKNGLSFDCAVEECTPSGDIGKASGPDAIFDKPVSLNQAKNMIEGYIRSTIADPECPNIGGQVHIGKLTSEGFEWIIPPESEILA
jgi:hypothetical protein